ncbi:phenazine biosynthesis PhzF [Legionella beliardensis]|uniref:Phenazine biosynthesis PhzF n=1 Tax=Legionella beliardensis TaxID=91822 RepID=A0A378I2Z4_9GAMM|nr:PhzF family phenazine biosynthesis protein [Legionella beliardensis]STX29110.1 phenazine biosynthesis PhzF [Legionella beliardensis]
MDIEIFQIDAFTDKIFHGNPAAVCLLDEWLNDELMQAIAFENNLSETAFIIEDEKGLSIRWFTPRGEVSLCGHATLAAGFVLFELGNANEIIEFSSQSGSISVSKKDNLYTLDFPRLSYQACNIPDVIKTIVDKPLIEVYESELDYLAILADEEQVSRSTVNLTALTSLAKRGLILSSISSEADFYSRCFYPKHNIAEDPVTGSAHCVLAPYWSARLNKISLHGIQGSYRKGEVFCEVKDRRVSISGHCRWYLKGKLFI